MIGRLFLWILIYCVPLAGGSYVAVRVVRPRLRLWLEQRRRQRLGTRNAKLLEYQTHELCIICQKRIEPEKDIYDGRNDNWLHETCHRELLGYDQYDNLLKLNTKEKP